MHGKRLIAFIICLLIAGGAAGYIVYVFASSHQNEKIYGQMQNMTAPTEMKPTEETSPSSPSVDVTVLTTNEPTEDTEPVLEKESFVSPINFVEVQKINQDIYAWIEIPGLDISFPILQHNTDPDYYLMHTADGTYGWPGAIYTHTVMPKDFSFFNTIIYGHNMINGTMFEPLEDYRDEKFLMDHRDILIYTPYKTLHYTVFAAILYNNLVIDQQFDFAQEEERIRFLDSLDMVKNLNNHICDDITVGPDDHIITLETCASGDHDHRYLVLAVLTDVEE